MHGHNKKITMLHEKRIKRNKPSSCLLYTSQGCGYLEENVGNVSSHLCTSSFSTVVTVGSSVGGDIHFYVLPSNDNWVNVINIQNLRVV